MKKLSLHELEKIIAERIESNAKDSYSAKLASEGLARACQKLGEESVETIIAALQNNDKDFCNESADLLYHLLIVLYLKNIKLDDILEVLYNRHNSN